MITSVPGFVTFSIWLVEMTFLIPLSLQAVVYHKQPGQNRRDYTLLRNAGAAVVCGCSGKVKSVTRALASYVPSSCILY